MHGLDALGDEIEGRAPDGPEAQPALEQRREEEGDAPGCDEHDQSDEEDVDDTLPVHREDAQVEEEEAGLDAAQREREQERECPLYLVKGSPVQPSQLRLSTCL